jgi:hypothetical protein
LFRSRVFLDVLAGVVYEPHHVMVIQRVKSETSGPADANEVGGSEQTKLMGHGRLAQAHQRRQVAHTPFPMRQGVDQADPRGVAQQLEDVGNRIHGGRAE